MDMQGNGMCRCSHHKVMPILIVLFGLDFLAGYMGWLAWDTVNVVWPILIILAGLMKLTKGACKCCSK